MTQRKPGDWPFINIERQAKEMADAVGSAIDKIRDEAYKRGYSDALGESQPTQPEVTEEHVGRLVMCRQYDSEPWIGPYILTDVLDERIDARFRVTEAKCRQAKLYTGPTRPNWIEHDGREFQAPPYSWLLFQMRGGALGCDQENRLMCKQEGGPLDIMRYTIIEP